MNSKILHKPTVHLLLIGLLCVIAYSNTFYVPFQFDDHINIINDPIIKEVRNFFDFSRVENYKTTHHFRMFQMRYMASLSFALNYLIHGLDVPGYHVVNLVIHIFNSLLVYTLIILSFRSPFLQGSATRSYERHIALFGSLFFAVHPLQTQAVTYIVQRHASLATLFYLFSLVMYVKTRLISQVSERIKTSGVRFRQAIFYLMAFLSAILAMKTKPIAFTLPFVLILYDFLFFKGGFRKRIAYLCPLLFIVPIIPLSFLSSVNSDGDLVSVVNEAARDSTGMSRFDYLFTQFRVIVTYIRLIFLPIHQNITYDYPSYNSLFQAEVFFSFLFLISICSSGFYILLRCRRSASHARLISFGIFWFFMTLSVESSIIPIADIILEHRMYLPSVGVFIVICSAIFIGVQKLKERWRWIEKAVVCSLGVLVIILTSATYARNTVWQDSVTLWTDVVSKSPNNARGYYYLGFAYQTRGSFDKAIDQYKSAIEIYPNFAEARNGLGNIYMTKNLYERAIEEYLIAVRLSPNDALKHYNLANAFKAQGKLDQAVEEYQTSIRLYPMHSDAFTNLGNIYMRQGLTDRAIEQYKSAIEVDPDNADAYNNLGGTYLYKGLVDKAIEYSESALDLQPDMYEAHYILGIAYRNRGMTEQAEEHTREALRIKKTYYK
jgi:tetratricopeptide (TPR) repeat protein